MQLWRTGTYSPPRLLSKKRKNSLFDFGGRFVELAQEVARFYRSTVLHILLTAKSLQSCPTLCDPIDGSPPGSAVPGILQAGVGRHFLLQCRKVKSESKVAQLYPTFSDPMGCSLPGSSAHGIFQARVLEWGAIAFSGSAHIYHLLINICITINQCNI